MINGDIHPPGFASGGFRDLTLIISPPRASSTALARVMWNHPLVNFYCHEPYEHQYLDGAGGGDFTGAGETVIALSDVIPSKATTEPRHGGLLVKEISFQAGPAFERLASLTKKPVIFLVRDPRLTIRSRMDVISHYRGSAVFDPRESGWEDLYRQVVLSKQLRLPYVLVDASDLRRSPETLLPQLFGRLGLEFSPEQLHWDSLAGLDLARLRGSDDRFFTRVLASTGIEPPAEVIPDVESFPEALREHAIEAVSLYRDLLDDPHRLRPGA
jgi:hypothetical protein